MSAIKVGIIGCGAIGTELAQYMDRDKRFQLLYILDEKKEASEKLLAKLKNKPAEVISVTDMEEADLIIEAASQECVRERMPGALEKADVMIMSVGAFSDTKFFREFRDKAEKLGRSIHIPSGAIAGLDALKAAAQGGLDSVTLTTRKHPSAFEGAPWVKKTEVPLHAIKKPTVIFEGTANRAIAGFPKNINVAITLALAGVGPEQTKVKIIADPFAVRNAHEIDVVGKFGTMNIKLESNPSPYNKKTSRLAAFSAIATLRKLAESLQIGT
ncbi:MAG: aspartate dehydrogenase [Candidatus Aenigmatarchaeota archaeon]|nr:MAG: aspartate dehydrogenase [Candidatus Aenigmarchaeota archaeon]